MLQLYGEVTKNGLTVPEKSLVVAGGVNGIYVFPGKFYQQQRRLFAMHQR